MRLQRRGNSCLAKAWPGRERCGDDPFAGHHTMTYKGEPPYWAARRMTRRRALSGAAAGTGDTRARRGRAGGRRVPRAGFAGGCRPGHDAHALTDARTCPAGRGDAHIGRAIWRNPGPAQDAAERGIAHLAVGGELPRAIRQQGAVSAPAGPRVRATRDPGRWHDVCLPASPRGEVAESASGQRAGGNSRGREGQLRPCTRPGHEIAARGELHQRR